MVNPFLQTKKSLTSWKIFSAVMVLLVIGTYHMTASYKDSVYNEVEQKNKDLEETQKNFDSKVNKLMEELKQKEDKLKKYEVQQKVISQHIRTQNRKIAETKADYYAMIIIRESVKRGHSPNIQAAILDSEADYETNPRHALSYVVGMGGINWKVWGKYLQAKGIAHSINDLKNPVVAIKSSAEIFAYYNNKYSSPREALAGYKGYCSLGKSQAGQVMKIASNLKGKVDKEYGTYA